MFSTSRSYADPPWRIRWVFFDAVRGRRPSALGAAIGAVVGLVAITPAAGFVTVGSSIAIGIVASIVSNLAVHWKAKSTLDDTLDVFDTRFRVGAQTLNAHHFVAVTATEIVERIVSSDEDLR